VIERYYERVRERKREREYFLELRKGQNKDLITAFKLHFRPYLNETF